MESRNGHEIKICMGSSCFCRGNDRNAEILREELKDEVDRGVIDLRGTLCEGRCREGPIICVDGREYTRVQPSMLGDLLADCLGHEGK